MRSGRIPWKTNHAGRKTFQQKLQNHDEQINQIQITSHKNLQSTNNNSAYQSDKWKTFQIPSQEQHQQVAEHITFQSAHHFHATINLEQTRWPCQYVKTSCKRCFMAIQLKEEFSTLTWPRLKVQWAAPKLNLLRRSFAVHWVRHWNTPG